MTPIAFFLIFGSIVLHSLWHYLCKSSGKSSICFFALYSLSIFFTMMPFAFFSGILFSVPGSVLKYSICGAVSGAICSSGLALAYKHSEISLVYPLARALPVFLTLMITAAFGWGKPLSFLATAGMIVIFTGCFLMTFSSQSSAATWKEKLFHLRKGLAGILIAAFGTTGYTISDSFGIQAMLKTFPETNKILLAGTYSFMRESSVVIIMWLLVLGQCIWNRENKELSGLIKSFHPYCAGIFAALAYVLILISMNYVSNVCFLQAFRQMSLPLSALLGFLFLKEKISLLRLISLLLIMAGLFMSIL